MTNPYIYQSVYLQALRLPGPSPRQDAPLDRGRQLDPSIHDLCSLPRSRASQIQAALRDEVRRMWSHHFDNGFHSPKGSSSTPATTTNTSFRSVTAFQLGFSLHAPPNVTLQSASSSTTTAATTSTPAKLCHQDLKRFFGLTDKQGRPAVACTRAGCMAALQVHYLHVSDIFTNKEQLIQAFSKSPEPLTMSPFEFPSSIIASVITSSVGVPC